MLQYAYKGNEIRPWAGYSPYHIYAYFADVSAREYFNNPRAIAHAYRVGSEKIKAYFGDLLPVLGPHPFPFSYGHLVCLGGEYEMPENTEPNVHPFAGSADEAIRILKEKKGMDFGSHPLVRHYVDLNDALRRELPGMEIPFYGPHPQGPFTSAMLMRGVDFIYDIVDEPDKAEELLSLMTDSIIEYRRFLAQMNGLPFPDPDGSGIHDGMPPRYPFGPALMDDFAAQASPDMWPRFVIPFWNRIYESATTGPHRFLHCEDMKPPHLQYLQDAKITYYQPSVSNHLTVDIIKAHTDVKIDWLLYSFRIVDMTDSEIQEWVDQTVEAGVRVIRTQFGPHTHRKGKMDRILAFFKAFEKYRV